MIDLLKRIITDGLINALNKTPEKLKSREKKEIDIYYFIKLTLIYIKKNKDVFNLKSITLTICAWLVMLMLFGFSIIYISFSIIVLCIFTIHAAKNGEIINEQLNEEANKAKIIQKEYKEKNLELDLQKQEAAKLLAIEKQEAAKLLAIEKARLRKEKEEAAIEAAKIEQEKFEKFRNTLISIYYDTSKNCIKIDNFKDFVEIVQINQSKIIEIDHKYVKDFLRVSNILENHYQIIQKKFKEINQSKYYQELVSIKDNLDKDIKIYQHILALALTMLSALISKNLVAFFSIYEQFDSCGIFDSHHEMKIQQSLSDIKSNINTLGSKVEKITVAVYEMGYLNGSKLDSLNNVISDELTRVNSNISYPKLVENLAPFTPAMGLAAGYKLGYSLTGPSKK